MKTPLDGLLDSLKAETRSTVDVDKAQLAQLRANVDRLLDDGTPRPPPGAAISFIYTNHRGHTRQRTVVPIQIRYASTPEHPTPVWLLDAYCLDKNARRSFVLAKLNIEVAS